ncbi:MAG: rod shape-determining protein MreC [Cryomorphaceae bacterium]|nr:rod shape-determining protein MreC [Cryomorphaceae bacterium]
MRSLWQLLFRYHVFFLFLILEGVSVILIVKNNNLQRRVTLSAANNFIGNLYTKRTEIAEYLKLQSINEELAKENAHLLSSAAPSFLRLTDSLYLFNDTLHFRRFEYTSARVVNNSVNRPNNFITIDKGSLNGIRKGMGVIAEGSVVGIIKDVEEHFATIMPILNVNFSLSVKLSKSGAFGQLKWPTHDPTIATVVEVPKYARPEIGDTITTTGFSTYFPEDILVGIVESYESPDGENFFDLNIRLTTKFYQLNYVQVVNNFMSKEQLELEARREDIE